jgi:hypothetical protein
MKYVTARQLFVKFSQSNFREICRIVYALLLGHRQTASPAHSMDTTLSARVKYPGVLLQSVTNA